MRYYLKNINYSREWEYDYSIEYDYSCGCKCYGFMLIGCFMNPTNWDVKMVHFNYFNCFNCFTYSNYSNYSKYSFRNLNNLFWEEEEEDTFKVENTSKFKTNHFKRM